MKIYSLIILIKASQPLGNKWQIICPHTKATVENWTHLKLSVAEWYISDICYNQMFVHATECHQIYIPQESQIIPWDKIGDEKSVINTVNE